MRMGKRSLNSKQKIFLSLNSITCQKKTIVFRPKNRKLIVQSIQLKAWDIKSANATGDERYRLRNNGNISAIIPTATTIML
jgi:hypothetical protein